MLDDQTLLTLCLNTTGKFEVGAAAYNRISGNFDGEGISVGILQWNAGQGSLQILLHDIGDRMGWAKMQTFFKSDIHAFANMQPEQAVEFAKDHYISNGGTDLAPSAKACWQAMLSQPESIAAQQDMAIKGTLTRAKTLVTTYVPAFADRSRPYAFFFDLVTQSGGMTKKINGVWQTIPAVPIEQAAAWTQALALAAVKDGRCYTDWTPILNNGDALSRFLMHYAFERASWSRPEYIWDGLSRRGSIACRTGHVHGAEVNLNDVVD